MSNEDEFIKKRTYEETKQLFEEKGPRYIVLNKKVRKDVKGNEELDVTLFDLTSESEQGAITTITTKDYKQNTRVAQDHEIERAKKLVKDYRKSIWTEEDLTSDS